MTLTCPACKSIDNSCGYDIGHPAGTGSLDAECYTCGWVGTVASFGATQADIAAIDASFRDFTAALLYDNDHDL